MPTVSPFRRVKQGVRAAVRLTPKSAQAGIDGLVARPGGMALKAKVREAPEKGRANDALLRLLAEEWGVPCSRLEIAAGESSRDKQVHIAGDTELVMRQLCGWLRRVGIEQKV
ncbi:MAG: DUF167 domain-containing protein [Pseudomonadota bacterium]|jgi:uncharacterized protein